MSSESILSTEEKVEYMMSFEKEILLSEDGSVQQNDYEFILSNKNVYKALYLNSSRLKVPRRIHNVSHESGNKSRTFCKDNGNSSVKSFLGNQESLKNIFRRMLKNAYRVKSQGAKFKGPGCSTII